VTTFEPMKPHPMTNVPGKRLTISIGRPSPNHDRTAAMRSAARTATADRVTSHQ